MKNNYLFRRLLVFILIICMMLGSVSTVFADEERITTEDVLTEGSVSNENESDTVVNVDPEEVPSDVTEEPSPLPEISPLQSAPLEALPSAAAYEPEAASAAEPAIVDAVQTLTAADLTGKEEEFEVKLSGYAGSSADTLRAAVWSDKNGQDDLEWIDLKKKADDYTAVIKIKDHKTDGLYYVDVYDTVNTKSHYVDGTSFTVNGLTCEGIAVEDVNINAGTCRIVIKGASTPSDFARIRVPVWSKPNQSDLLWYDASKDANGDYYVDFNIANHKNNTGKYTIHVYGYANNGISKAIGTSSQSFSAGCTSVKAVEKTSSYEISLEGVQVPGGVSEISFAVWSEIGGQDDLKWFKGSYDSKTGAASVSYKKTDFGTLGKYLVHVYAKTPAGNSVFVGLTTYTIAAPEAKNIYVESDNAAGTFKISTDLINDGAVSKLQAAVWSTKNQSDLVWYTAKKDSTGKYTVDSSIAKHKYNLGTYTIHMYAQDGMGNKYFVGAANMSFAVKHDGVTIGESKDGRFYPLTIKNLEIPGGAKLVKAAVWSEKNGQDDLVWYPASLSGDDHKASVDIAKHKTVGKYIIHVYAETLSGASVYIGKTEELSVEKPSASGTVVISDVNEKDGTFKITVTVDSSSNDIASVDIPVWCQKNQSDLYWYKAAKQSDGTWTATAKAENHNYSAGTYYADVYPTYNNGIRDYLCGTTQEFKPEITFMITKPSSGHRTASLGGYSTVSSVRVAVWSQTNGQDDLVWYNAVKNSSGVWTADINVANHAHDGLFYVHVYSGDKCLKTGTFTVAESEMSIGYRKVKQYIRQILASTGGTLYGAHMWAVNNLHYAHYEIPRNVPAGYTRLQWYLVSAYETRQADCYAFASVVYWAAEELGMTAILRESCIWSGKQGRPIPHGWVEINQNGGVYVCDPQAQNQFKNSGTPINAFMQPYAALPFDYRTALSSFDYV